MERALDGENVVERLSANPLPSYRSRLRRILYSTVAPFAIDFGFSVERLENSSVLINLRIWSFTR